MIAFGPWLYLKVYMEASYSKEVIYGVGAGGQMPVALLLE